MAREASYGRPWFSGAQRNHAMPVQTLNVASDIKGTGSHALETES